MSDEAKKRLPSELQIALLMAVELLKRDNRANTAAALEAGVLGLQAIIEGAADEAFTTWSREMRGAAKSEVTDLLSAGLKRERARAEKAEADCRELRWALELTIDYHSGGPWSLQRSHRWEVATGSPEATTKALCDYLWAVARNTLRHAKSVAGKDEEENT